MSVERGLTKGSHDRFKLCYNAGVYIECVLACCHIISYSCVEFTHSKIMLQSVLLQLGNPETACIPYFLGCIFKSNSSLSLKKELTEMEAIF